MAKVDLLRPQMGTMAAGLMPKISFGRLSKFLFFLSGVCLFISLLLALHIIYQKRSLSFITSEYRNAEKQKGEIGSMYKEREELVRQIGVLEGFLQRGVVWSVKLDELRRLIPKEAWLKKLSFDQKSGKEKEYVLTLSGSLAPSRDMSAIAGLSHLMNQLKGNQDFFAGFDNPVLSDVRSETKDKTEVMSFIIDIPMAKEAGSLQ